MKTKYLFILPVLVSLIISCKSKSDNEKNAQLEKPSIKASFDTLNNKIKVVVGIGKIEPETEILPLASDRGGIIDKVFKGDGDMVKKGDMLLSINSDIEQLKVELIRNQILTQQNQIKFDKASITEAEARLANKNQLLTSSTELIKTGAETRQNLDDLKTEVKTLDAILEKSLASLAVSESKLRELNVELRSAIIEVAKRNLRAPSDGIVLDVMVTPGSAIPQYGEFAQFAPSGRIIARCEIDELFANKVQTGQTADITLVGNSEILTTGKVIKTTPFLKKKSIFSELAGDKEDRRVREVWILLDNPSNLLYNTQVECIISLLKD